MIYKIAKKCIDNKTDIDVETDMEKEGYGYLSQKRDRTQKSMMRMRSGTRGKSMFRMSARAKKVGGRRKW